MAKARKSPVATGHTKRRPTKHLVDRPLTTKERKLLHKQPKATPEQLEIAERILNGRRSRREDHILQDICRLLDSLDIENIVQYETPGGPADLFLSRRRTLGEVKRTGYADAPEEPQKREGNESPRGQMERYLLSEIENEVHEFTWEDEEEAERPWTGFVTDGKVWHVWQYQHKVNPIGQTIYTDFRPATAEVLIALVRDLVKQGPIGKPWVPENIQKQLSGYRDELAEIFDDLTNDRKRDTETKLKLWFNMLKISGMAPRSPTREADLFIRHSLLVTIARGVIHTLTQPKKDPDPEAILNEGFVAWIIDSDRGQSWARKVLNHVHSFEWRRRNGDVLRPVYEELIDSKDRKDFGEVYTPDWLAALIVHEVLDDEWCERAAKAALRARPEKPISGIGVLDPACGSGTFLYHAARRIAETPALQSGELKPVRKAEAIARLINGIDVHPVAAEVARATVLRGLPAEPPDGDSAIQISQGDSLISKPGFDDQLFTHSKEELRIVTPGGSEIHLPKSFARGASFITRLRSFVEAAALGQSIPEHLTDLVRGKDRNRLRDAHGQLRSVIEKEGNSVWAWFIANVAGPVLLSERKIDRIVTNPPWVRMAQVQVKERQRELIRFAKEQDLWIGATQAPHFDIAQLFVKRCRELYMSNPDSNKAGWLVKRSAITGGNWAKFRKWHERTLRQTLDLSDVEPFGGGDAQRCCILFDHHECELASSASVNSIQVGVNGRRPEHYLGLDAALNLLTFTRQRDRMPRASSDYVDKNGKAVFRQGATITPKVLVIVGEVLKRKGIRLVLRTMPSMHKPWKDIDIKEGEVPARWLYPVYVSDGVFPFSTTTSPRQAIIPTTTDGVLDHAPETELFWKQLDRSYDTYRGRGQATPKTLLERINFNNELDRQLPFPRGIGRRMVLQVTSGDIMRATRVLPLAIVDSSFHYWIANTENEAAYLAGLLNTPALNQAYIDARNSGRDFVNHVWTRVPIPKYNPKNPDHWEIVKLTREAEKIADACRDEHDDPARGSQLKLSKIIRETLDRSYTHAKLNAVAMRMLPDQVT